ncbi:helix-turn-helix domain-containing protein [Kitasatospora viridis]|uniref:AraC family transcriptional regulator n=1 Tax=Kitasatospora viridis TaxID=281105 RepID=A0A561UPZ6_9ACTN|nr:helix-turn-helix domain-containing protein [Kitasatospora viridis]TWG01404.1 AraC family transcriptional regulator [Kitasatospora viridis]
MSSASTPIDESVRTRPAAALRPYVAWYSGYRQAGLGPTIHRGLPSPYLTLILTLDEPLVLAAHPDPAQPPGEYRTLLGGLHTSPALITHQGSQSGVQIAVSPLGARALFGLPAGELASGDYSAEEVLGRWATEGQERLCAAADWPGRFRAVDRWLLQRAAEAAAPPPEVVRAWRLLLAGRGLGTAASLAAEVGWSTRHLAARFNTEIGLTPKAAARVIRFDRARRLLGTPAAATLADLAADCGYFDQAHLAREFNALAGCPPTRYLREEPPDRAARPVPKRPSPAEPVGAGWSHRGGTEQGGP